MKKNFIINPHDAKLHRGIPKPAREGVPASYTIQISTKTKEIAEEVIARMADQGLEEKNNGQVLEEDGLFLVSFVAENNRIIRDAFKKVKNKTGYNAPGLSLLRSKVKVETKKTIPKGPVTG